MTVYAECCRRRIGTHLSEPHSVLDTVTSESGLTVGELYDVTARLRKAHEHCPHANIRLHSQDGTVNVRIEFVGDLEMRADDSHLVELANEQARTKIEDTERIARHVRMEAYVTAKETGMRGVRMRFLVSC